MNADQLEILCKGLEDAITGLETMIQFSKTQADRIAELEKLLKHSVGSDCREMRYIQEIENKDARIAELEKKLKHYKMAWNMAENELENQTKPLSDDEIKEIADSVCYLIDKDKKDRTRGVMYIEDFARAIEERHGIK